MEFIYVLAEIVSNILFSAGGFLIGYGIRLNKFQPHDESTKVGKHKEAKEVSNGNACNCSKCTGFKSADDYYSEEETG